MLSRMNRAVRSPLIHVKRISLYGDSSNSLCRNNLLNQKSNGMHIPYRKSSPAGTDGHERTNQQPMFSCFMTWSCCRYQRGRLSRACAVMLVALVANIAVATALGGEVTALTNATIETVSDQGVIENGTVLIEDGKIKAVGTDVDIPVTARVIDARGRTIMPAIVDPYHPISLGSGGSSGGSRTIVINGRVFTINDSTASTTSPFQRIADNLDPQSLKREFSTNLRYGVGLMHLVTRGYGQSVHAKPTPNETTTSITKKDGGLFIAVTNATSSLDVLRNGLKGKKSSSSGGGRTASTASGRTSGGRSEARTSTTPQRSSGSSSDASTALWTAVREGKQPLFVNVNNASTILYVLKIQDDYDKLRIVLVADAASVFQTLDALRGRKVSVVLGAGLEVAPRSQDRINVPRLLADAKIEFAFSTSLTGSLSSMSHSPLFPVSLLVKTGLDRQTALKALTQTPTEMMGLGNSHGSIETGKTANLIVFDGDPLSTTSQLRQVLVEGSSVYEN